MAKKRILFFLPPSVGGAERITITIAKILPKDEYVCHFVIVGRDKGEIINFIPECNSIDFIKIYNIWCFSIPRIYKCIKKIKPYAVFCSLMYLNVRVAIAGYLAGIKIVLRNCNYMSTIRWDQKILCKLTYSLADVIVSQQEEMRDDIIKELSISKERIKILYNPIDTFTIDNSLRYVISPYPSNNQINFVWVGRFHRNKGQDIATEAFYQIHTILPSSHLYLVGKYDADSIFYKELLDFISVHNLQSRVHIIGFDSNPYKWIKFADCFVLPSRIEGLPNTLIESQYLGVPAAAVRCIPMIDRIICDGVNGFIAQPNNPNSLSSAMIKACQLGRIKMTYSSASDDDFVSLFK